MPEISISSKPARSLPSGTEKCSSWVEACGICAGDIKAHDGVSRCRGRDGMPAYVEPLFTPGHEIFRRNVAIQGEVPGDFKVGDRVIPKQIVPCGECWYCKCGMYSLCDPHNVYGFRHSLNGGMAEYAVMQDLDTIRKAGTYVQRRTVSWAYQAKTAEHLPRRTADPRSGYF